METIYLKKINEIKKLQKELEKKLNIKISIKGKNVTIDGSPLDEYEASQVFDAINFGFSIKKALQLKEEDIIFKKIHIKEYTKRNLKDIKARLIGKHGKTRKTISEISDCEIIIGESDVGIIGYVENVEDAATAITNIIKGSKQTNMYRYLERMNKIKKKKAFVKD